MIDYTQNKQARKIEQELRRSTSLSHIDEFVFEQPEENTLDGKKKFFEDMFPLPTKRKATNSPESKDLSKKEKKQSKKENKTKLKTDQKAKAQLEVSPTKL